MIGVLDSWMGTVAEIARLTGVSRHEKAPERKTVRHYGSGRFGYAASAEAAGNKLEISTVFVCLALFLVFE
jgi:hypothetical protein